MVSVLARNWWALALRGIFGIIFGILAFVWPGLTLTVLVLLFGAYALVDGIFALVSGVVRAVERRERWLTLIVEGLIGIIAGIVTFLFPGWTALALLYLIAAYAIVTGVVEIIAAIRVRQQIHGEFWFILAGIVSILFGVVLFLFPGAGALSVIFLIGAYGIVFGVLMLILAFRLRSMGKTDQGQLAHTA